MFNFNISDASDVYGKFADFVNPGPGRTWVILDEDDYSLNDAGFASSSVRRGR